MNFSRIQIFLLLVMCIGISNHVILLPHLLQAAHRDAWFSAVIGYFILVIWSFLLKIIIGKMRGQKLSKWLQKKIGRFLSIILLGLLAVYISMIALITFNDLVNTVQIYFLPVTSMWLIGGVFLFICLWSAWSNLKTIVFATVMLIPFVLIFGDFVAMTTMDKKDYSYAFPLLAEGISPLIRGIFIFLGASTDIILILLIQHRLKKPFSFLTMFLLISTLSILVIGPTLGSITSFGPEIASQMRFPAFEQWRLVTIGKHISHLDFLAVFQMISGTFIRLTLCVYFLWSMWSGSSLKIKWLALSGITLLLIMIILPQNSDIWMQVFIQKYFYYAAFVFGVSFTAILLLVGKLKNR